MEFKDILGSVINKNSPGINRIILEFKGFKIYHRARTSQRVLIESYWNLKMIYSPVKPIYSVRINRIILEFKVTSRFCGCLYGFPY